MKKTLTRGRMWWLAGLSVFLLFLGLYLFLYPGVRVAYELSTLNPETVDTNGFAFRTHRKMAPRYERWATERLASGRAGMHTTEDLVETEWPLFGSVFFLWATEALQQEWERDSSLSPTPPKEYAAGAIDAVADLLADPNHGKWVRDHWGDDYLHRENAFYRMLLIGGFTTHHRLTGSTTHFDVIRDQVETLSAEIEASPHGLLEDYPDECYPADVLTAIACILDADEVLGTDHRAFADRAIRGFEGSVLDEVGMVPFLADARHGLTIIPSRGSGNSYLCIFAPHVWPDKAKEWYALYDSEFWVQGRFVHGFREYLRTAENNEWEYADMDAGPVIGGFGMAASAFGLGAARANGRFDHAYPLSAQMIAATWPLPDGTLLLPRILSKSVDAPLLGEACILYNMTRPHVTAEPPTTGGTIPPLAVGIVFVYFAAAALFIIPSVRMLVRIARTVRPSFGGLSPAPRTWLVRTSPNH
ncbi:MAG: hypothetical protein DHS20C16_34140 [Phycisphaerae bacterium]|nr:MAG: hypothetical protein DHS20C16_34140 [Phycisphaerae bacterium]